VFLHCGMQIETADSIFIIEYRPVATNPTAHGVNLLVYPSGVSPLV
jgi:hypothetical protein